MMLFSIHSAIFLLLCAGNVVGHEEVEASPIQIPYVLLGVSGTLQDGFELRGRLDYIDSTGSLLHPAIFLGKGLVRGYKAYLDIKDEGWREYLAKPDTPKTPNAVVLPTGCREHANIYWLYFVPEPQFLYALANEPRFLSITPDTGMIDITSAFTDDSVKLFLKHEIERNEKSNFELAAVPLVTGVWFHPTFVECPPIAVLEDGTMVTSYDGGLARFAGVSPDDLVSQNQSCSAKKDDAWQAVYESIRVAERRPQTNSYPTRCEHGVRFGAGPNHARINYPFTKDSLDTILSAD